MARWQATIALTPSSLLVLDMCATAEEEEDAGWDEDADDEAEYRSLRGYLRYRMYQEEEEELESGRNCGTTFLAAAPPSDAEVDRLGVDGSKKTPRARAFSRGSSVSGDSWESVPDVTAHHCGLGGKRKRCASPCRRNEEDDEWSECDPTASSSTLLPRKGEEKTVDCARLVVLDESSFPGDKAEPPEGDRPGKSEKSEKNECDEI